MNADEAGPLVRSVNDALILAAATGNLDEVAAALEAGAEIDFQCEIPFGSSPAKSTALHFAADRLVPDMCEMLLAKHAKIESRNANGATPLLTAAGTSNGACIPALLRHAASTCVVDNQGNNGLHLAAVGSVDGVALEALLDAGMDVNEKNQAGQSALHLAVKNHRTAAVAVLLHHGANPTIRDNQGNQALHCLREWDVYAQENIEIAKVLIDAGADPKARGEHDRDLVLVSESHPQIMQMLAACEAKNTIESVIAGTAARHRLERVRN